MFNGEFLNKDPKEAWDYLESLFKNAQSWETSVAIEMPKQSSNPMGGGIYHLKEEENMNSNIDSLTRKIKAIKLGKGKEHEIVCGICKILTPANYV